MAPELEHDNIHSPIRNIGFISTRIAGTDGVSLEIQKWAEVLTRLGYSCYYFAGELDRPHEVSFNVKEAHFDHPEVEAITKEVFGRRIRRRETTRKINELKDLLKTRLYDFLIKHSIDLIIPENCLAIPMNIPLALAITELVAETGKPTIAHHHDFSWERNRFLVNACQDYLNMAFPPDLPSIHHVVINSLAAEQLSHRRGISNVIIPNVLDFANEPPKPDGYECDLRKMAGLEEHDPFILQPTRVVPRKWIERSIEIISGMKLKNPKLIISHSSGDEGDDYYLRIKEYARNLNVEIVHIDHMMSAKRATDSQGNKLFTIRDVYQCADLVTYPSGYEGFGNAFLEAIYFMKPILVNRYSIYVSDIEPKGFEVILIDGFVGTNTIDQIGKVLSEKSLREAMAQKNYRLARNFFSYEILGDKLTHILEEFVEHRLVL